MLKGKTWWGLVEGHSSFIEIDDVLFRVRIGDFVGMPHIAVMAAGQFIVMRKISLEKSTYLWIGSSDDKNTTHILNPRRSPYGLDVSWYFTFGKTDEIEKLKNSLVIEESNETPDDHT